MSADSDCELTSYAELADILASLPLLARERRRQQRLSLRAAATQIGVAASTLMRFEQGQDTRESSLASILRWLDQPATPGGPE